MICLDREQLFAYAQRMLAGREAEAVRAHVEQCARCRGVVEEFRQVDAVLDEWRGAEPTPWFDVRVRAALRSKAAEKPARTLFGIRLAPLFAAAVLAALVVAAIFLVRRPAELPRPVAQQQTPPAVQPAPELAPQAQAQPPQLAPAHTVAPQPAPTNGGEEELRLYENLSLLEDYELLANFEVLSELRKGGTNVVN